MNTLSNNRWIFVSFGHYLLLFLVGQLNHQLTYFHIHLTITGLVIAFSSLELNFRQSFLSLVPIAFFIDAKSPLVFGTSFIVILSLSTAIYMLRSRFRREQARTSIPISLAINLSVFSAYTFYSVKHMGWDQINIAMTFWNLFWSSLVIAILHPIYFDLQIMMLEFIGIRITEEQRET
ncbi:hypothetical protein MLD52_11360 [Puniceicoccaceae bacterium K14]|nr:hypothetical protein [Puniceicoccaceae bacterium K14]